jgi:hypothetical protein
VLPFLGTTERGEFCFDFFAELLAWLKIALWKGMHASSGERRMYNTCQAARRYIAFARFSNDVFEKKQMTLFAKRGSCSLVLSF